MIETPVQVISREEADQFIGYVRGRAAYFCSLHDRGFNSSAERYERISYLIFSERDRFMREKNLRIRIAAADWPAFCEAVGAWRQDGDEGHLRACRWLWFPENDEPRGIHWGDEACAADKALVLEILDACHIPVGLFRPVPEGIPCPDDHPAHYPSEYVVGFGIWEQDAGLVAGNVRIGDEVTLVDRHGLKTVIRIEEHTPEGQLDRFHDGHYIGTGTIEGYTSARPRQIKVFIDYKRKRVDYLKFHRDNDDCLLDFPLWREYRKDRAGILELQEQAIRDMIAEHSLHP